LTRTQARFNTSRYAPRRRLRSRGALGRLAFAGTLLLALAGCTSVQVALGLKMRLNDVPVTGLSATLHPGPALAPGQSAQLIIVANAADAGRYVTVGAGQGNVLFDSFAFAATAVRVDGDGNVILSADPRDSQGQTPHLRVRANGHPEVVADLDIPVRYDADFTATFAGAPGRSGFDGLGGTDGIDGFPGSIDLNHPSPGGNGTDGGDGHDGDAGGPGAPGEDVQGWITLLPGPPELLQVRVASSAREQLFLVDPAGGRLLIDASGGAGGRGGSGGTGGRGGAGGSGSPNGTAGRDGRRGMDGSNGAGGAAGKIALTIDPLALPYYDRFLLVNSDGDGRPGPPPTVRVESLPGLW